MANEPWKPAEYDMADLSAVIAVQKGEATTDQQIRAMQWIVNNVCGTHDLPYRPGPEGDRDTVFACGKMFVGRQIVAAQQKLNILKTKESKS